MATLYESIGISVNVHNPLIRDGVFLHTITDKMSSYSHQIAANGGYVECSIGIAGKLNDLEEWLQDGLGRHIVVYDHALDVIWEGFVNQIGLSAGPFTATRGPLTDITNRCSVIYTPIIDPDVDPPVLGTKTITTIADNDASIEKYGIWEKVLSTGNVLETGTAGEITADNIRDEYLAEHCEPASSNDLSVGEGGGGDVALTLNCKGYGEWLSHYVYNDYTTPVHVELYNKIRNVLATDPNGVISTDYSYVPEDNALLTMSYEAEERYTRDIIDEIVSYGDVNGLRYTFGIYAERKAWYQPIPTTFDYQYFILSEQYYIQSVDGKKIYPWNVLPARWVLMPDFLIGRTPEAANPRLDPRAVFIESITFTAPFGVTLQGNRIYTLPQILASQGLGAIS